LTAGSHSARRDSKAADVGVVHLDQADLVSYDRQLRLR
jgi:hypothetical protein